MNNNGMDVLERATTKAFDRLTAGSSNNISPDVDVKFYETLTPQAFDVIAATYGPNNLVAYVTAMETQRMKQMKGVPNG
jgi:hypothetical protein